MSTEHVIVDHKDRRLTIGEMSCRLDITISKEETKDQQFEYIELENLTPVEVATAALKMLEVACLYVKNPAEIMALVETWSKGCP